jgi:hypothetical protein
MVTVKLDPVVHHKTKQHLQAASRHRLGGGHCRLPPETSCQNQRYADAIDHYILLKVTIETHFRVSLIVLSAADHLLGQISQDATSHSIRRSADRRCGRLRPVAADHLRPRRLRRNNDHRPGYEVVQYAPTHQDEAVVHHPIRIVPTSARTSVAAHQERRPR